MASRTCPYCNSKVATSDSTIKNYYFDFHRCVDKADDPRMVAFSTYQIAILNCPECRKESVDFVDATNRVHHVLPAGVVRRCPDYIPKQIADDFIEAQLVLDLGPKSSATLCRRCLQGMIHDFWGVSDGNLAKEIRVISDRVSPETAQVLDAIRRIGNIGAHMEQDVNLIIDIDPDEASVLIELIGDLMDDWYVRRHELQARRERILLLDEQLQQRRSHRG